MASSGWSLDGLSTELVSLILEQLRDIDTKAAAAARCVCSRFDALATPLVYDTLVLDDRITACPYPRVLDHISAHTHHIVASSNLDPRGIKRILDLAQHLRSLRWRYVDADLCSGPFWMPSDVLGSAHASLRLHVEGLPLESFGPDHQDAYLRAVPAGLLVSLALAYPSPPLTTRLDSLKQLLLASPRLESLHYRDRGQGTRFRFAPNQRLPPVRHLVLESYDWDHSRRDVAAHWDLSRLQTLALVSVPVFAFLSSVAPSDLAGLRALRVHDYSAHRSPPDRRADASRALRRLLAPGGPIRALDELRATCHVALLAPLAPLLAAHAASLRVLSLRDHVGLGDESVPCPCAHPADLALLATRLRALHTLELDLDAAACPDPDAFLRALCRFPSLHSLTLHVQTVLREDQDADLDRLSLADPGQGLDLDLPAAPQPDPDHAAAMRSFGVLAREKAGATPWRSVTLCVGGWTPGPMVRRLSEAWRERNRRGVFAERCFVMERALEGLSVREETGSRYGRWGEKERTG